MAVSLLADATRTSMCQELIDDIGANGYIEFFDSADTLLAGSGTGSAVVFSGSFPAAATGASTISSFSANGETGATGNGTISYAEVNTSGGSVIFRCSVGATSSGADIELDSVVVAATGETITLTSFKVEVPAG